MLRRNTKRRSLVQYEDEEFEVLEGHPNADGRRGKLWIGTWKSSSYRH